MTSKLHETETMADEANKGADVESDEVAIIPEGFSSSFTDKFIRARSLKQCS